MWIAETIDLDDHDLVVKFLKQQSDKIEKLEEENEQLKQLNIPVDEIEEIVTDGQKRVIAIYYKKENPIVKGNVNKLTQIFEYIKTIDSLKEDWEGLL